MQSDITRRNFIKVAGATAGVAVATGYSPFSYAQNEKIRVAIIGTGGQGGFHLRFGLAECDDIDIVAVCDVYKPHQEAGWKIAAGVTKENPTPKRDVKRYMDYRKMLDEVDVDAVMIVTPLYTHYQIAMDCLDAGNHIFLQKTMCFDIEQCRSLVKKVHDSGKICQIGHQRRYNPEYNKALWLARGSAEHNSSLGRINHINAWWHRNDDWRRYVPKKYELSAEEKHYITEGLEKHLNWRLYPERSRGGLITELATHQLDVAAWFLGGPPARVSAFGGIDYWKDGREVNDNIVMVYEYDMTRDKPGFAMIPPRNDKQKRSQINRDYKVRLTYSSICANAYKSYGEHIQGDRGSVLLTEQHGCTYYPEPAAKEDWNKVDEKTAANAQKEAEGIVSGKSRDFKDGDYRDGVKIRVLDDRGVEFTQATQVDRMQFAAFAKDLRAGTTPKSNEMVGLMTAVSGFSALEAMEKGCTVEIDPALYAFDFETPDPFRFDFFEEPEKTEEEKQGEKAEA